MCTYVLVTEKNLARDTKATHATQERKSRLQRPCNENWHAHAVRMQIYPCLKGNLREVWACAFPLRVL